MQPAARGIGAGSDIYRALQRQGMELLNFSSGTRGGSESILELTDIQNSASLANDPLEIELATELAEDEFILPLVMDGDIILLTGDPSKDEQGRTHISISEIPQIPDNSRSLTSALKLYFFKTYLCRKNVNELCWVEYKADGTFERHVDGVAEKVAAANNVVLLIHGIIGDTESMAQGMGMATDANGVSLANKFDVVLTYDYENLSTPIAATAVTLKQQLKAVGLHQQDDKRLTLMAHSMGGLVSRWFIEREAGKQVVDHLVLFGTPNVGSPFGKVDSARKLSNVLTTLAINAFPAAAPLAGVFVYALNRSKKVTPTLEQMNPESDFIKALNASEDPGVPYTIMAGDMREFNEGSDDLFPKLIAKVGGGPLFDMLYQDAGHDIAVSDASIHGVDDSRTPPPRKAFVACHHLNYFVSESGLKAMGTIEW